ncbi:MAG: redox-sensing transcriptional repressor Rex [Anaerolineales bacterium]|nr:redox-sensing transcriptional repressor Rex [Anaerolineales bacterium]MDP2977151.1 redox-sensing transcriptional repressor Rex [Anaerolineales bacterium]MDP3186252.1 redox-sensing transcriptional repressor Rex [Anaerolineales bacterium]
MVTKNIPNIIVSRLPVYLRALNNMQTQGQQTTSSQELGEFVSVSAAQIRKDLSQFGEFGKQGTGYNIAFLIKKLGEILKVDRVWDVAVIGMGDMGRAIARYQGFTNRGFRVAMVFDSNPALIGQQVGGFVIQDAKTMVEAIREAGIKIAMLTVPAAAAQEVANQLIEAGVKAILNYAPISLSVLPGVMLQYLDPSIGLQRMTYYLE